jgi:hypothetical protein
MKIAVIENEFGVRCGYHGSERDNTTESAFFNPPSPPPLPSPHTLSLSLSAQEINIDSSLVTHNLKTREDVISMGMYACIYLSRWVLGRIEGYACPADAVLARHSAPRVVFLILLLLLLPGTGTYRYPSTHPVEDNGCVCCTVRGDLVNVSVCVCL